jgi:hypothetical protein
VWSKVGAVNKVGTVSKVGTVGTAVLPASVDEASVLAPEAPFRVSLFRAEKREREGMKEGCGFGNFVLKTEEGWGKKGEERRGGKRLR